MRKRTINHLFDTIFWYVIYSLPLIVYLVNIFKTGGPFSFFDIFINPEYGLFLADWNPFGMLLYEIFGNDGIFPLFGDQGFFCVFAYFISCWMIHLAVDVLLFIVRWSHSMIDGFLGGKHD